MAYMARCMISFCLSAVFSYLPILLLDKKYRKTRLTLLAIFVIFYILQLISLVILAHDINYAFLANMFDITIYVAAFSVYRKYSILLILLAAIMGYVFSRMNDRFHLQNKYLRYLVLLASFSYLLSPASLVRSFLKVCRESIYNPSSRKSYDELFREITGLDYVNREEIRVRLPSRPKNLVIIELESFEQRLLENFREATRDINSYADEGEFYSDIAMVEGSGWTMGGIHTFLCGSPMLYGLASSPPLKLVSVTRLVCLPDILSRAGYYQLYLGGEKRKFSGKSQFFFSHGYDEVLGTKELSREYGLEKEDLNSWGVRDLEVFRAAKDKYRKLAKSGKPFSIMISTLDTHDLEDGGLKDARCKNSTGNDALNRLECTNDLLADFINFLKNEPNYEDTVLVILPDHLLMSGVSALGIRADDSTRRLYVLLLNTALGGERRRAAILYTDIPSLILERLGLEHNAKFLLENHWSQTMEERLDHLGKNLERIRTFNEKTLLRK